MKEQPWAVVVDGDGAVSERKLADQSGGTALAASVTVVSSTAAGATRVEPRNLSPSTERLTMRCPPGQTMWLT